MQREEIIMVVCCDLAGQVRGKGFPARELAGRMKRGIGWVPTNSMITAFGAIADSPWGALGDLLLVPDPETDIRVDFEDGLPAEHFYLGDITHTDGRPWGGCPRGFLKGALEALAQETGLRLVAAFEHEFYYTGVEERVNASYGLDAFRRQGSFGEALMGALRAAGVEPDSFMAEFGPRQYEVTVAHRVGVKAADDAVVLREMARAVAHRLGHKVSFSPLVTREVVGNGVHLHMSLIDGGGRPVMYDPAGPGGMSEVAGRFAAGILRHAAALCAVTAPSVISYDRLVPHRWSASANNLGFRDREACLRICPVIETEGADVAAQYNLEFRAADAAASPYLQLGALVHAGLAGIRDKLPAPTPTARDLAEMPAAERAALGIETLPRTLGAALDALEADAVARAWFPDELLAGYLAHKRFEIGLMQDLSPEEQSARYAEAY